MTLFIPAAVRKGWRKLSGNQRIWESPRRNGCADPDGLTHDQHTVGGHSGRHDIACDALTLLGKPLHERCAVGNFPQRFLKGFALRSEEHTSELQSLMRISYAVFCLKKKKNKNHR